MPGVDGLKDMQAIMAKLRAEPPKDIAGIKVVAMRDYQPGTVTVADLGVVGQTPIKGSNVLYFELDDGSSFIVRPSGTEPKIKVYLLVRDKSQKDCAAKIESLSVFAEALKNK